MVGRSPLLGVLLVALEPAGPPRLVLQLLDVVRGALEILADALLALSRLVWLSDPRSTYALSGGLPFASDLLVAASVAGDVLLAGCATVQPGRDWLHRGLV